MKAKSTDQEVVLMSYLRPILRERLAALQALHADDEAYMRIGQEEVRPIGAVASIALTSGIPDNSIRRLLRDEHIEYIDLDQADRLCLAFGLFIEIELPEEAFVNKMDAIRASREQSSMFRLIARCRGMVLDPDRHAPTRFKRQLAHAGALR